MPTDKPPRAQTGSRRRARLDVRKTYKLYIGGAFPRSESGRSYVVNDTQGPVPRQRRRRPPARTPATPSSAARKAFGGWSARTAYNRGQVLYRIAEVLEGRRDQFVDEVAAQRGRHQARRQRPPSTRRSTGWSGTPAGPTRSPRSSAAPTRSPARTSTSRCPSRPAWSRSLAPQDSSLLGLVSVVAPVIVTGNTVSWCSRRTSVRCRRSRCPRCWRPPTCRAASSTCSPAARPRSRRGWPRTWTSTRST